MKNVSNISHLLRGGVFGLSISLTTRLRHKKRLAFSLFIKCLMETFPRLVCIELLVVSTPHLHTHTHAARGRDGGQHPVIYICFFISWRRAQPRLLLWRQGLCNVRLECESIYHFNEECVCTVWVFVCEWEREGGSSRGQVKRCIWDRHSIHLIFLAFHERMHLDESLTIFLSVLLNTLTGLHQNLISSITLHA